MAAELYPWIIAGIGGAAGSLLTALLLLIPKIGEAFFKARFDRALEAYKAKQNREMESLRERMNHIGDRGRRSNENEFNALRSLWEKFMDAYYSTYSAVINFIEFPPLNRMTDDQITDFLIQSEFDAASVQNILASSDREQSFSRAFTWRQIVKARKDNVAFIQELRRQRVFISNDIRQQFNSAVDICSGAQAQRQIDHARGTSGGNSGTFVDRFLSEGDSTVDALATAVNQRLFRDEAR